jgi:hypothetical protein
MQINRLRETNGVENNRKKDKIIPAEYLNLSALIFLTFLIDDFLRYYTSLSSVIPLVRPMSI